MARRERVVTLTSARDKGKTFRLREKSAHHAERWALRLLLALANAGAKLPEGALDAGLAGLAAVEASNGGLAAMALGGVKSLAGLDYRMVQPLLDEMLECVKYQPPGGLPPQDLLVGTDDDQVEDAASYWTLYYEVLQIHVDFSLAGVVSTSGITPSQSPA